MSCDKKIENRLKRAEGQIRGILRMMEEEKDCQAVLTQLMAVRSSIDKVIGVVVEENVKECLAEQQVPITEEFAAALQLISKTR